MENTLHADNYLVHKAVFSSGERFPVLLHSDTLQPAVLATRYILDERRETRQASTIEKDVRVLYWLYEWCASVRIDLESRLCAGNSLTAKEIQGVSRWIRSGRNSMIVGAIGNEKKGKKFKIAIMQPSTFNNYLSIIERFLVWAAEEFIPKRNSVTVRKSIRDAKRRIKRAFKACKAVNSIERARRYGLSSEELIELRESVKPGGESNPFRRETQRRNHLIIETMLATGVRAGELLKIRIGDLPRGPKETISIVRQPDAQDDPRIDEPRVKTRSREIPIPKRLAVYLTEYALNERGRCAHPYLFISSRGKTPLSKGGLSKVFSLLQKRKAGGLKRIHPHLLRHTFNDLLLDRAKEIAMTDDVLVKVQNYLNGWVEGSNQSEVYTRRFVEAEALQLVADYQFGLWRGDDG